MTAGGEAITTGGAVLTIGTNGLILSEDSSTVVGAIFAIGSSAYTAIESTNSQGSTIIIVGDVTATVGSAPITLPGGEVVSVGTSGIAVISGMVVASGKTIGSIPYSVIETVSGSPNTVSFTTTDRTTESLTTAVTTTSKKGLSSEIHMNMTSVLVVCFLIILWAL